jgi:hypothetical protein
MDIGHMSTRQLDVELGRADDVVSRNVAMALSIICGSANFCQPPLDVLGPLGHSHLDKERVSVAKIALARGVVPAQPLEVREIEQQERLVGLVPGLAGDVERSRKFGIDLGLRRHTIRLHQDASECLSPAVFADWRSALDCEGDGPLGSFASER